MMFNKTTPETKICFIRHYFLRFLGHIEVWLFVTQTSIDNLNMFLRSVINISVTRCVTWVTLYETSCTLFPIKIKCVYFDLRHIIELAIRTIF